MRASARLIEENPRTAEVLCCAVLAPNKPVPAQALSVDSRLAGGRIAAFRVEAQAARGGGRLDVPGASSRAPRDVIQTARSCLKKNPPAGTEQGPERVRFSAASGKLDGSQIEQRGGSGLFCGQSPNGCQHIDLAWNVV